MATKFLEPGGDATFNVASITAGGFWTSVAGATPPVVATDFVHGNHIKSILYAKTSSSLIASALADAGSRISLYIFINALPGAEADIFSLRNSTPSTMVKLRITTGGVLKITDASNTQIGSNGSTLSTGIWYRISLAYTITDTTHNRFEFFVDGVSSISITDGTISDTGSVQFRLGNLSSDTTFDLRSSDHYIDDSSSLTDTGDIWVTAKRPNADGALNQWTTQIGVGGSGYGAGHSPQVNERALDTANGWSFQDAARKFELYIIESKSEGDINITGAAIKEIMGWAYAKVGSASTGNLIAAGTAYPKSVTTSYAMYTEFTGDTTLNYPDPADANAIGFDTNTVNQLFSLAECGIIVAYIPRSVIIGISTVQGLSTITF